MQKVDGVKNLFYLFNAQGLNFERFLEPGGFPNKLYKILKNHMIK